MHPAVTNSLAGLVSRALLLAVLGVVLLAIVLLGGFWLCWGIYMLMLPSLGAAGSASLIGLVLLGVITLTTWLVYRKLAYLKVKRPLAPTPTTLMGQPMSSAGYQAGLTAAGLVSKRISGSPVKALGAVAIGGLVLGLLNGSKRRR